jgi:hypothetical protein
VNECSLNCSAHGGRHPPPGPSCPELGHRRPQPAKGGARCTGERTSRCPRGLMNRHGFDSPCRFVARLGCREVRSRPRETPPLTTVSHPQRWMGREVGRLLLDRLTNPEVPVRIVDVPLDLVVRDSASPCSPPARCHRGQNAGAAPSRRLFEMRPGVIRPAGGCAGRAAVELGSPR